jgi:hypothetical protein
VTPGLARARVKAPLRQRLCLVSWGDPCLLRGPSFKGDPSMTEAPCPTVLKYQRSSYTSNAIVFDADLNLHSLEQLRELASGSDGGTSTIPYGWNQYALAISSHKKSLRADVE